MVTRLFKVRIVYQVAIRIRRARAPKIIALLLCLHGKRTTSFVQ